MVVNQSAEASRGREVGQRDGVWAADLKRPLQSQFVHFAVRGPVRLSHWPFGLLAGGGCASHRCLLHLISAVSLVRTLKQKGWREERTLVLTIAGERGVG